MKKVAFLLLLFFAINSCKKENCNFQSNLIEFDVNTYKDSTIIIYFQGQLTPSTNICENEIKQEPLNGIAELSDSTGIIYSSNPDFVGTDELTYIKSNCNDVVVSIKVWSTPDEFCTSEINNLTHCEQRNHSTSKSTISSTLGHRVINPECYDFIESVEILEEPKLGTAEFDGEYLNYTFGAVEGEDKIKIQVCLNIENTTICNERTWFYDLKRT